MWKKIKEKLWVFLLAIAALIGALLSKPKWERKKVKEIKERDKEIKREKRKTLTMYGKNTRRRRKSMTRKSRRSKIKKRTMWSLSLLTILMMLLIFCGTLYAESPNLDDLFTPENIILLANHIQELEARNVYLEKENQRLELENKQLEAALAEERQLVVRLKENEDRLLSLLDEQVKDLKFVYEKQSNHLL